MTIKEFRKRCLRAIVHPEMFLLPCKKSEPTEQNPFIFEIADEYFILPTIQFNSVYSPSNGVSMYGTTANASSRNQYPKYKHLEEDGFIDSGSTSLYPSINTNFMYNVCYAETPYYIENGEQIPATKETHPELYTDIWPCHDLYNGKVSEKLISDNLEPPRIELDDGTTFSYTWGYSTQAFHIDSSTGTIYYIRLRLGASIAATVLKDEDGNNITHPVFGSAIYHIFSTEGPHIVKLFGTWPGFRLPYNMTAILQWGDVGITTINNLIFPLLKYTNTSTYVRDPDTNTVIYTYRYQETPAKYYLRYVAEPTGLDKLLSYSFNIGTWDITRVSEQALTMFFNIGKYIGSNIISIGSIFYGSFVCDDWTSVPQIDVQYDDNYLSNKPYLTYIMSGTVDLYFYKMTYSVYTYPNSGNQYGERMNMSSTQLGRSQFNATIGDNFLANTPRFYISSGWMWFNSSLSPSLVIGDNYMRGSGVFDLYYVFHSSYMKVTKIGKNCFADCRRLRLVYQTFYNLSTLEEIGEGLFSGCPNINYIYQPFYYCTILKKIPDKLFYDLEFSMDDYDRDLVYFYPYFAKSLSSTTTYDPDIHVTKIGKDMFSPSFLSTCKMYIGSQFATYYSTSTRNSCGESTAKYLPYFSGYVPDFWNYPDNVGFNINYSTYALYTVTDTYVNLLYGSNCGSYYGYFGYPYAMLSTWGGADYYCRWDNQDDIPQPRGLCSPNYSSFDNMNDYYAALSVVGMDQLWLYANVYEEVNASKQLTCLYYGWSGGISARYSTSLPILFSSIDTSDSSKASIWTAAELENAYVILDKYMRHKLTSDDVMRLRCRSNLVLEEYAALIVLSEAGRNVSTATMYQLTACETVKEITCNAEMSSVYYLWTSSTRHQNGTVITYSNFSSEGYKYYNNGEFEITGSKQVDDLHYSGHGVYGTWNLSRKFLGIGKISGNGTINGDASSTTTNNIDRIKGYIGNPWYGDKDECYEVRENNAIDSYTSRKYHLDIIYHGSTSTPVNEEVDGGYTTDYEFTALETASSNRYFIYAIENMWTIDANYIDSGTPNYQYVYTGEVTELGFAQGYPTYYLQYDSTGYWEEIPELAELIETAPNTVTVTATGLSSLQNGEYEIALSSGIANNFVYSARTPITSSTLTSRVTSFFNNQLTTKTTFDDLLTYIQED